MVGRTGMTFFWIPIPGRVWTKGWGHLLQYAWLPRVMLCVAEESCT